MRAGGHGRGESPAEWCPFPAEDKTDAPEEGTDR